MKKFKAYISCPVNNSLDNLNLARKYFSSYYSGHATLEYWDRNEPFIYDNEWVSDCDIFIIMLPENKFSCEISSLPYGCKKEFHRAISLNKPVFIAYKRVTDGEFHFYQSNINLTKDIITAVAGSFLTISSIINDIKANKKLETTVISNNSDTVNNNVMGTTSFKVNPLTFENCISRSWYLSYY